MLLTKTERKPLVRTGQQQIKCSRRFVGETVDFSSPGVADRAALLLEAADRLDRLSGHLGPGQQAADPYGQLLRDLITDRAEFAAHPDLRSLPAVSPAQAAVSTFRMTDEFSFWWLRIPLLLFPRRSWGFTRLEVRIELSPTEQHPERRPKAFDILPNRRFDTLLKAKSEVMLGVGVDGHFAVEVPEVGVAIPGVGMGSVGAGASAKARIGGEVGVGPLAVRMVAARVDHTAEGLEKVFWRLDGAEFFEENQPELVVVLQVPKGVETFDVVGVLQAYRRFNLFPAGLQAAVRQLPEALRVFFSGGAPLSAQTTYALAVPASSAS